MPYVILTAWFPPHKSMEVAKQAIEIVKKVSGDNYVGKNILPGAVMRTKDGIKGITIAEIEEGQLQAALDQANDMAQMYEEVEGLTSEITIWGSMAESLTTLGLKIPD